MQLAVKVYPKTSLRIIEELLKYGAGTELPPDDTESPFTPLWIAVEMKHPLELVRLLLSFKSDIFFRSAFSHDEKGHVAQSRWNWLFTFAFGCKLLEQIEEIFERIAYSQF